MPSLPQQHLLTTFNDLLSRLISNIPTSSFNHTAAAAALSKLSTVNKHVANMIAACKSFDLSVLTAQLGSMAKNEVLRLQKFQSTNPALFTLVCMLLTTVAGAALAAEILTAVGFGVGGVTAGT